MKRSLLFSITTALVATVLIAAVSPVQAVDRCKVKVGKKDGGITVDATGVSGTLLWGSDQGEETNSFFNASTCVSGTKAKKCQLASRGTLASRTPPAGCRIYLADGSTNGCSVWIKGCTPGSREDTDTTLTEAQVETFIENGNIDISGNFTAGWAGFASSVQIGDDTAPCTTLLEGSLRWTGESLEVCSGSAWEYLWAGLPAKTQADARLSCKAIRDSGDASGDGLYWIDPNGGSTDDAFEVYCEMTTQGGGWTLVTNIHPADGSIVSFTNTEFWISDAEYGQIGNHFTNDYKSPAAYLLAGAQIMVQVAEPGSTGRVIGWKAWNMSLMTFDAFFDASANTTQTTSVIGSEVTTVYAWEPIIKNGDMLQSNRNFHPNADRVRLGVDGYPAQQGDDNQAGLGTQMNESICGVGNNCYRYKDVELLVDAPTNLWCTGPASGTYKWIGTDGGCGASCSDCDEIAGPPWFRYWTYRIYVRE